MLCTVVRGQKAVPDEAFHAGLLFGVAFEAFEAF